MGDRIARARISQADQPNKGWQSNVPCRFFARGQCRSGANCQYSHATNTRSETPAARTPRPVEPSGSPLQDSRAQVSCRFFLQGRCLKGTACPFSHAENIEAPATKPHVETKNEKPEPASENNNNNNSQREMGGAFVQFGDGAVVEKISLPSDFSAVRINRLPGDASPTSVTMLLSELGFDVSRECIRVPPRGEAPLCSANVRVEDTQFAKRLCTVMRGRGDGYEAIPISAPMPQATNSRRVDAKKVHCSWHKPTRTAWLNFGSDDVAGTVAGRFSSGIYKVLGQKLPCHGPSRSAGVRNPLTWTVRLSDLPSLARNSNVVRDIPIKMRPRHIELSEPTFVTDTDMANTMIESLLLQAGPLERWETSPETNGKRFKANARFVDEADARQAVKMFHDTPLPFNRNGKLTVQLVHSARLKVSSSVYDAVEDDINGHRQAWASQHLLYASYPPDRGFRVVKIEGEASADVAKAKAIIESLLAGEVMMVDGEAIWANSFAGNSRSHQRVKELERRLGIVIVRDKRKCQLRVLGARSRFDEARKELYNLAQEAASSVFEIELDAAKLSWAFRGGFRAITAAIGADKATLDIVSNPRRILVAGSEADFDLVQGMLQGRIAPSKGPPEAASSEDCAICWTEAEDAVYTACKHCYCSGCFEDLCVAGTSALDANPRIQCQGDGGKCGKQVCLAELQDHLSSAALEDVLEAAFASYLARHPDELRYCPTPDCTQVYRTTQSDKTGETLFTCPACLVSVCTKCHVPHSGLTCAEQRYYGSSGSNLKALEETKKKLGIKDCPKCGTMIEKTEGCNHMTCRFCSAHICWVCMEVFSDGKAVYPHMERKHGSIGIEYWPNLM